MSNRKIEISAVSDLKLRTGNPRTHSKKQIRQIADSIERFGFVNPVLIDENNQIIAGHGRVAAAKLLGWQEVPTLRVEHLDETEKRAYVLADNRLAEEAGWDKEMLAIELQGLIEMLNAQRRYLLPAGQVGLPPMGARDGLAHGSEYRQQIEKITPGQPAARETFTGIPAALS